MAISLDIAIFNHPKRQRAAKLAIHWPADPQLPDQFKDLDTRKGLTYLEIQELIGGGSPGHEIDWLVSVGVLHRLLAQRILPVTKVAGSGVPQSVAHLVKSPTGNFYAMTEEGRRMQRLLREDKRYESLWARPDHAVPDRSVSGAGAGSKPKADRAGAGNIADHGAEAHRSGEEAAGLSIGRDAGGGVRNVGAGELAGDGPSSSKLPSFLKISDSGGDLTQADSTDTTPATSQVTSRKPRTAPRVSGNNA